MEPADRTKLGIYLFTPPGIFGVDINDVFTYDPATDGPDADGNE